MDWFTILLIFIFFILPLIQQIAEARRRKGGPEGMEIERDEWEPIELEQVESRRRAPAEVAEDTGWSQEWGRWPGADRPAEERPQSAEVPDRPATAERASVPQRTPAPVAAPEPPRPERSPRERIDEAARALEEAERMRRRSRELPPPRSAAEIGAPERRVRRESAYTRAPRTARTVPALESAGDLRRAIILKEILDRPLGLRDPSEVPRELV